MERVPLETNELPLKLKLSVMLRAPATWICVPAAVFILSMMVASAAMLKLALVMLKLPWKTALKVALIAEPLDIWSDPTTVILPATTRDEPLDKVMELLK